MAPLRSGDSIDSTIRRIEPVLKAAQADLDVRNVDWNVLDIGCQPRDLRLTGSSTTNTCASGWSAERALIQTGKGSCFTVTSLRDHSKPPGTVVIVDYMHPQNNSAHRFLMPHARLRTPVTRRLFV